MIRSGILLKLSIFLCIILLQVNCTSTVRFNRPDGRSRYSAGEQRAVGLLQIARQWLDVPYRYGGNDQSGIDCSGLTCRIYEEAYQITLPRTAREQMQGGVIVRQPWLQEGDLLFFREGRGGFQDHVGIYLSDGQFIHASVSSGVTISNLFDSYFQERLISVKRYLR